MNVNVVVFLSG